MEHVTCPECGHEQRLVLGDYAINRQVEGVAIYHVGLHGAVIVGSGDDLAEALRDVADSVENPEYKQ